MLDYFQELYNECDDMTVREFRNAIIRLDEKVQTDLYKATEPVNIPIKNRMTDEFVYHASTDPYFLDDIVTLVLKVLEKVGFERRKDE